ncbi:hypothetical protein [Arthrobacter sp. NIO-1057]|uniref:hypothetical protein n=1 Tax=Arthrobacter sp. NIO-1057 TaxID=993071 RepID=UPI00071CD1EC|nr:hypothetical protein [Arthrobacter sp. NIO-1057]KSU65606.1 hypothetical protein AS038_12030 [Arthrobacter sp. NIO-1057]SCC39222.1 hypothetical protein GA0061084_2452 [Arthrobacter sp. NIO-1057]
MGTKSSNTSAIARATGTPWETWSERLESAKARELTHKEIAELAYTDMPADLDNPGWWAQSVAIAYEQQIGRRLPGQAQDGTFQGSVSTTLAEDLDGALACWEKQVSGLKLFNGQSLNEPARTSTSERWRYWRASFSDGTKAQVDIGLKVDKCSIAINITKAKTPDQMSEWKSFWRQILAEIKG